MQTIKKVGVVMEEGNKDSVKVFDDYFTTGKIQMLKVLFPRLPLRYQTIFAVYIKIAEINFILTLKKQKGVFFPLRGSPLSLNLTESNSNDIIDLLNELTPYASTPEKSKIESIKTMLTNFSQVKEMMSMLDTLKEMFPDGFGTDLEGSNDFLSGMMSQSGMDLSGIFNIFGKENENES